MKKVGVLIFCFVCMVVIFAIKRPANRKEVIGILQTASHPALDRVRDGFLSEIGDEFELRIQNAEGLVSQAQSMAHHFHRDNDVIGVFTIATPATQSMVHLEREKPIVFSAVTDPSSLGMSSTQRNVTGCRDMINVKQQVLLIRTLVPQAKRVALLCNPSEVNSVALANLLRNELQEHGLQVIDVGIQNEAEVAIATRHACQQADLILTPTDNTVASTIQLISRVAKEFRTPLIVSDNLLVSSGALAACGVDYFSLGKEAARMMRAILLEQRAPIDIPIRSADRGEVVVNQEMATFLGLQEQVERVNALMPDEAF